MLLSKAVIATLMNQFLLESQLQFIKVSDQIEGDSDILGLMDSKFCLGIEEALEQTLYAVNRANIIDLTPSLN